MNTHTLRAALVAALLLPLSLRAVARQCFRFAQLSDIHIGHGAPMEALMACIEQINADSTLHFVLVTGDITEGGDNRALLAVHQALSTLRKPCHTVAGNHESTWSESGMQTFIRLFGSERWAFCYGGYQFVGFSSGPYLRMALGHIRPQDLSWMGQQVRLHGQGHRLVAVTHYPLDASELDNWYEAADSLRSHGALCAIGGHFHQNIQFSHHGLPGFAGRSSLRDKEGNPGYTVYEFTPDSLLVYEQPVGRQARRWGGISLTHAYYNPQEPTQGQPSFAVNDEYPQVRELWSQHTGVSIYSSAVVWRGRAYVGDGEGGLRCLDLDSGQDLWTHHGGGKIVGTPAVAHGVVVHGSTDGHIYGVDAHTGQRLWRVPTDGAQLGAVAIHRHTAWIGGSDHRMRALDIHSGRLLHACDSVQSYVVTRPLIHRGRVVFGAWDGQLYGVCRRTGQLQWRWRNPRAGMHFSPAQVWPVARGNTVFVADPDRALTAIDIRTGEQLWRTRQSRVRESLGISADGRRLYAKTMQDSIVCFEATPSGPRQLWRCHAGFGYEHASSMLCEQQGIAYASTKDGLIMAIDGRTGRLRWKHKVGNSLVNTVTPAGGGRILVTTTSGHIVLLKEEK